MEIDGLSQYDDYACVPRTGFRQSSGCRRGWSASINLIYGKVNKG
jgi:hypothetical protein